MDMHAAEYQSVARSKTEAFRNVTASKHFFFFLFYICDARRAHCQEEILFQGLATEEYENTQKTPEELL